MNWERASQKPFDGVPYTRLATGLQGHERLIWTKDVFVSRRIATAIGASPMADLRFTLGRLLGDEFSGKPILFVSRLFCQSKRPQPRRFFSNETAVSLIFHHRLCAFSGSFVLFKARFGASFSLARPRFTRFCRQCRLLVSAQPAESRADTSSNNDSANRPNYYTYICVERR